MSAAYAMYAGLPGVNWSTLKEMGRSPLHYRHALATPREATEAMVIGSATHVAVLEPAAFASRYAIWRGARRAGKEWDAFEAAASLADMEVLREQDIERVNDIAAAVRSNPVVSPYLDGVGAFEASVRWTDAETVLDCKGRVDRLAESVPGFGRVLVDLKTARDANPRVFAQQAARLGYHAQLAFYADGLAASGRPVDKVVIIIVESSPPYDSGVLVLDDDVLYAGREHYRGLLRRLAQCRAEDRWPGRYEQEAALTLPAWVFESDEDDDDPAFGLAMEG